VIILTDICTYNYEAKYKYTIFKQCLIDLSTLIITFDNGYRNNDTMIEFTSGERRKEQKKNEKLTSL